MCMPIGYGKPYQSRLIGHIDAANGGRTVCSVVGSTLDYRYVTPIHGLYGDRISDTHAISQRIAGSYRAACVVNTIRHQNHIVAYGQIDRFLN